MEAEAATMSDGIAIRSGYVQTPDVRLAYEDWGEPGLPPLVLIMGLGAQMVLWPDAFCRLLVQAGLRVIRFDNRDTGLSGKIESRVRPPPLWLLMARAQFGLRSPVPYTLEDMAEDTAWLMRKLNLGPAHVAGASMGGMIAQILAARHPGQVASLTVLFSSTNQPLLPPTSPPLLWKLISAPHPKAGPAAAKAHAKMLLRALGTSAYPIPEADLDQVVDLMACRGMDATATRRQLAAVLGTGDLRPYCRRISAPALVIHGDRDRMLPLAAGRAVARAIPGAKLHLIPDMGHDLPPALWPLLSQLIARHVCAGPAIAEGRGLAEADQPS
jgi:pimeloyl-ACP methyl ester carboxylesterase